MAAINLVSRWGRAAHKKAHSGSRQELRHPKANPQHGCAPEGLSGVPMGLWRLSRACVMLPLQQGCSCHLQQLCTLCTELGGTARERTGAPWMLLPGESWSQKTRALFYVENWWILGKDPCKFTAAVWRALMNTGACMHMNCHRSETSGPPCLAGSFFDRKAPRGRMLQIRASPRYPQGLTEEELLAKLQEVTAPAAPWVTAGQHPAAG